MSKRLLFAFLTAAAIATTAACSSGGGNVTANNPLNPSPAPPGTATSSPTPVSSATTPGTTPTTPTPSPSAILATPSPSPSPSATSSSSGTTLTCTHNTSTPTTMTYSVGNGTSANPQPAETIMLPSYPSASNPVIAGTSSLPTTYTSSGAGTTLTIKISQANFDNVAASTYGNRTPDFFTSLEVNPNALGLGNGSDTLLIPVTITSPCVTPGTTYTVNEYDSTLGLALYSETDVASATTVNGHIQASVNPFTNGQLVDVIVSH